ncbi:ABC transporter substrate-binding protein [Streptomyces sp. NPDC058171]
MPLPRRGTTALALAVAAALALTACGSDSATESGSGPAATDRKAGATPGPVEEDFTKVIEQTAALGTDAAPGEFPRTVKHAMGTVEIPARPQRVVVLDVGELDNVVSLGVKPVGYAPTEGDARLPSYLREKAGDPKSVGTVNALNLEAIAALKPDLILGTQLRLASQYAQLKAIAPTVLSLRPGFPWKENYLLNAAALDRTAKARAGLAAYEEKAADLGRDLGGDKPTVTMLRYMPGEIRLYARASFIGTVLEDVGIPRPKNQQADELSTNVSTERIDDADADWIFTGVYGDPAKTDRSEVEDSPLWEGLGAVEAGRAEDVSEETWYLGLGVTAAHEVLDDLRGHLLK